MAIRAVLARRSRYDRETIVLETIVLPIKLPAHMVAVALCTQASKPLISIGAGTNPLKANPLLNNI